MNWKNLIDDYEFYLRIERGLAENTVQNYSSDIFALAQFISSNN
ncbi:MAG: site-specific integrase, partial [Flavobacteriaceae bacterium]